MQGEQLHPLWTSYHSFRSTQGVWWCCVSVHFLGKEIWNYTTVSRGRSRNRIGGSSINRDGGVDKKLSDVFAEERIRKTYTILLSFTLMVRYCACMHITGTQSMVMSLICKVTHWHFSLQIWLKRGLACWDLGVFLQKSSPRDKKIAIGECFRRTVR